MLQPPLESLQAHETTLTGLLRAPDITAGAGRAPRPARPCLASRYSSGGSVQGSSSPAMPGGSVPFGDTVVGGASGGAGVSTFVPDAR